MTIITTYGIHVTSYRGISIGAEHYYGKAWKRVRDTEQTSFSSSDPKSQWEFDIERELTSPKEIAALNKKDNYGFAVNFQGQATRRFNTRDDVIHAGVKLLREEYGDNITIIEGSLFQYAHEDNTIVYSPAEGEQ